MSFVSPLTRPRSAIGAPAVPLWLSRAFAIDVRALAFLRIGLGCMLLVDLAGRASALTAHYTDAGILPRSARMALSWEFCEPWWMSLHMLSGSWWWQAVLFLIAAVAAGMLVVGYRTKSALFVSCILLISLHGRFPLLTQGGDMLLRCMLVWALFVPLDACWSWGGKRSAAERRGYVVSMGTVAVVGQLAMMYLFSAMLKTSPAWRNDFSATYYALSIDHFTTDFGYSLLEHPKLLQFLTWASFLLERVGPMLLLFPFWNTSVRLVVPLAFMGFHLGLAAAMDLGTFPWICILLWATLLPPRFWDAVERLASLTLECLGLRNQKHDDFRRSGSAVTCIGSPAANIIAGFLLAYVVLLNLKRLENPLASVGEAPLNLVGKVTGLEQYWNMFAPGPYRFGSWLRVEGETAEGQLVNLYSPNEPLPAVRPKNVSSTYSTQYWRRCMVTMYEFQEKPHLEGGLRYFAGEWNRTHAKEERIVRARLVHMIESTPPPFAPGGADMPHRQELCEIAF